MKYIRTKVRIYESADHYTSKEWIEANCGLLVKSNKNRNRDIFLRDYEITEQANTIEELCDEFVIETCSLSRNIVCSTLDIAEDMSVKGDNIYGAIWTDTGLKYVAKMNEKGELELL